MSTLPHFDLGLTGREVPLARQAGLIIRGDLDLHLRHGATNPPTVEGSVVFGRSLVLSDLGDVLERRVRTAGVLGAPVRVSQEPLAGWRLAVELRGDEFLQLKSPFYNGVHSVNLKLRGTLGEPLLLGDAQVVRGLVVFPYASLRVQRGIVTFSEEAPWRPRVEALASARVFGYDVRVEVGGNADVPVVQFSSSPPLSSEAILMMMTAGELPRHQLNYSTTQRMTRLATILGRDVMNKLGGQDAGEARLSVRSGEGISTGGRVTQSVEYRLSERFSLVGEYDEYDALNAGVKWRILRR
jgi:translocation and assembly module TamB